MIPWSDFKSINASIIQGSGLGPVAYVLNASDLCSAYQSNLIFKYADDTYLIVPDTHLHTIPLEVWNCNTSLIGPTDII